MGEHLVAYHSCKGRPAQCERVAKPGVRGGTKGFTSHHNTIWFGIPRNHQQSPKDNVECRVDEKKWQEDGCERGGEGPMDVAIEELRWLVHIDVNVVGVTEVIRRQVYVMTVNPVKKLTILEWNKE